MERETEPIRKACAFAARGTQSNQCPIAWPRCPYCRLSGIKLPELGGTEVGEPDAGKAETQKPAEVPQKKALRNDLLTAAEAAAFLKVTEGELRDLRRRKRVAYSKLGYRSIRFRQQDLDDFIERYRVSAIGEPIRRSVKG